MLTPEEKIERFIKRIVEEIYTIVPGYFVRIHKGSLTADVKMSIRMQSQITGVTRSIVQITNVPIVFPVGSSYSITYPVEKGDHCILAFSQSELTEWKTSIEPITSIKRSLRYDMNNAIAFVGGYSPLNNKIRFPKGLDDKNIRINGTVKIGTDLAGAVAKATETTDALDTLADAVTELLTLVTPLLGPAAGKTAPFLAAVKVLQAKLSNNSLHSSSLYAD